MISFFLLWGGSAELSIHLLLLQSLCRILKPIVAHQSKSFPANVALKFLTAVGNEMAAFHTVALHLCFCHSFRRVYLVAWILILTLFIATNLFCINCFQAAPTAYSGFVSLSLAVVRNHYNPSFSHPKYSNYASINEMVRLQLWHNCLSAD